MNVSMISDSRTYMMLMEGARTGYEFVPFQMPPLLPNDPAIAANCFQQHYLSTVPIDQAGLLVAVIPIEQFPNLNQFSPLANALSQSLSWLEANTDDDPAIIPALIQAYTALAQFQDVDPLALRRSRTGCDSMPQIVEGIGEDFESEWDWSDRTAKQFLQQHSPTQISIQLAQTADFTFAVTVQAGQNSASCLLENLDPDEATSSLQIIQRCWQYHGFTTHFNL